MKEILLGLPPELVDALEHLGGRDETTIGDLVRSALRRDLQQRRRARTERKAKRFAPLRAKLDDDLNAAISWGDLQQRLRRKGFLFVRRGGGLSLEDMTGQHLCSASDLGHSHARLMRRFGGPISQPTEFAFAF